MGGEESFTIGMQAPEYLYGFSKDEECHEKKEHCIHKASNHFCSNIAGGEAGQ